MRTEPSVIPDDGKPVIFLDVDGVLNFFPGTAPLDAMVGTASPEPGMYQFRITWRPEVIDSLRAIHNSGVGHVVWMTTWGSGANGELRKLLGFPEFPVAEESPQISGYQGSRSSFGTGTKWWKFEAVRDIVEADPDRKYVWLDDDLSIENGAASWARNHGMLVIAPRQHQGLTDDHLEMIENFVTS